MDIFYTAVTARVIFILGIVNLLTGALIFFSCRCLSGSRLGNRLMRYKGYQRFYKYHCHVWKVFWPSVMVHAILAVIFFGWPS
jgi:hypothetical protein